MTQKIVSIYSIVIEQSLIARNLYRLRRQLLLRNLDVGVCPEQIRIIGQDCSDLTS